MCRLYLANEAAVKICYVIRNFHICTLLQQQTVSVECIVCSGGHFCVQTVCL
jgi:hypothetical protein